MWCTAVLTAGIIHGYSVANTCSYEAVRDGRYSHVTYHSFPKTSSMCTLLKGGYFLFVAEMFASIISNFGTAADSRILLNFLPRLSLIPTLAMAIFTHCKDIRDRSEQQSFRLSAGTTHSYHLDYVDAGIEV